MNLLSEICNNSELLAYTMAIYSETGWLLTKEKICLVTYEAIFFKEDALLPFEKKRGEAPHHQKLHFHLVHPNTCRM